jgi:hypothetical protein
VEALSARHVVDTLQAELMLPSPNAIPQSNKAKSPSRFPDLANAENEIVVPKIAEALTRPCEDNPLEVAFVFGPYATLGGFPPWMTHLCEIFHMVRVRTTAWIKPQLCAHTPIHTSTRIKPSTQTNARI